MTTELLGLCPPWVSNKQCPVVGGKLLLQFQSARGIDVFGVVGNDSLCDGLPQGVHLRGVSSTFYPQADVDVSKVVLPSSKDSFVNFESEDFRPEVGDWGSVNVD